MSFWALSRKIKNLHKWGVAEHFPGTKVLLDSGAYSANKASPGEDWVGYSKGYADFVEDNLDTLDLVTEFDCVHLDREHIESMRAEFYDHIDPRRFIPVWHAEHGFPALHDLAEKYDRLAVPASTLMDGHPGVLPRLAVVTRQYGTQLHAAGVSGQEILMAVPWATSSSTSWLSAMRYGETIVWDGTRLHRYSKDQKEQARRRYHGLFIAKGFDPDKIDADDPQEVTRLALWSWRQMEEDVTRRRVSRSPRERPATAVTVTEGEVEHGFAETPPTPVAGNTPEMRKNELPRDRPTTTLPVLNFEVEEDEETGERTRVARLPGKTMRACDNCFVASNCPAFDPGAACAFDIPVEVRTKDQLMGLLSSLLEMQAQRVAFMRFSEEAMGGYADPNLSGELDRMFRLTESLKEIQDNSSTFKVQMEARSGAGVLSRLFGEKVGEAAAALGQPLNREQTDAVIAEAIEIDQRR